MPYNTQTRNVKLSVVIPLYNEEKSLEELYKRITIALQPLSKNYQLIFIDDGSTDNSFTVLRDLHKKDTRVKALCFRKNFGKAAALSA
jgi:glycosyltransferase involved in cell wall biosynthesis